jgi:hypothetical protein
VFMLLSSLRMVSCNDSGYEEEEEYQDYPDS